MVDSTEGETVGPAAAEVGDVNILNGGIERRETRMNTPYLLIDRVHKVAQVCSDNLKMCGLTHNRVRLCASRSIQYASQHINIEKFLLMY